MVNTAVEKGNKKAIWWLGLAGCAVQAVMYAIAAFIAVAAGSEVVSAVINAIPQVIRDGLANASKILPAIGIGVLMQFAFDIKYVGFFILGFILPTFLGFNSIAVALTGFAVALIYFFLKPNEMEED